MLNPRQIFKSLRGCASLTRTLLVRTDRRHWRRVASAGVPSWDARNQIIAAMIPPNSSVVDLGCGARTLQRHLNTGCVYMPFDVVPGDSSVTYCDFNRGVFPRLASPADFAICSGVLEYMWNPRDFLQKIAPLGRKICLSYNPLRPGETRRSRLAKKWVNHLTELDLQEMFSQARLSPSSITRRPPTEVIFELESLSC